MSFHEYQINELYSNPSGTIQFIELTVGNADGESFWAGVSLSSTQNGITHTFKFPANLPSTATANTMVLIATKAFADVAMVTPNFIVPDGFLFPAGGSLNYGGVDIIAYPALPTDGVHSLNRSGDAAVATPQNFAGVAGNLPVPATIGNQTFTGGTSNDTFTGGQGNDAIDGLAGTDTALYSGNRSNFALAKAGNGFTLTDSTGLFGTDTLSNMERLKFSDGAIALDVGAAQSGGETALLLGAVLPGRLVFDSSKQVLLGAVIDLFDQGYTLQQLSGAVMRLPIWDVLTGRSAPTNTDIATYLLTNVNGAVPDAAVLANGVASLDAQYDMAHAQGDFLWHLAEAPANQARLDLVGLATTGLAFG